LDRLAVARSLREIGELLTLSGEDRFRARAYERAAGVLERVGADLGALVERHELTELPGIGKGLAAVIAELHLTGRSATLDQLRSGLPPGALELSRASGLGVKRIAALHAALGVETVAELAAACEAGRARGVRGIGPATERRILEAIRTQDRGRSRGGARGRPAEVRLPLHHADALADSLLAHLRAAPSAAAVEIAGELRRSAEAVDRLVVVAASSAPEALVRRALEFPLVGTVAAQSARGCSAALLNGVVMELRVVDPDRFAVELFYATGAPAHVGDVERAARERGFVLAPTGLWRGPGHERVPAADEPALYRRLGLPPLAPELREGAGEVDAALAGTLPDDLVTAADLRGLVHCHTVYSDGRHSIEEMARAADRMGVEYLTITDHSPTASYAGGLTLDRLRRQWDEIARVQEAVAVRLLRGTESDILADGGLDYPDEILEQLDVVIASIHARHRMDADQMTSRLVRAMRHPCFKIWGHPLGRLVLSRPPIACRVEEVLDAVAASRAAVEINGDPHRLDLPPRWIRAARERGIRFVISTDAHSVGDLDNQRYGAAMARRGWVGRREVLNALDAPGFRRAVSPTGAG
jgi:DNA polymerase (family 10)